jgi:hypothetical protein
MLYSVVKTETVRPRLYPDIFLEVSRETTKILSGQSLSLSRFESDTSKYKKNVLYYTKLSLSTTIHGVTSQKAVTFRAPI